MRHEPTLRPVLGPLALTTLGIGSVIGTGIFVLTGTAASLHTGPALVVPVGAVAKGATAVRLPPSLLAKAVLGGIIKPRCNAPKYEESS